MRALPAVHRHSPWRVWLGLVLSSLFLYLAIHHVDWTRTATTLRTADPLLVGLGLILLTAAYLLFAIRWQVLLQPAARISVRDTFSFIMIGYLANTVLPLRLGDVSRAALLGSRRDLAVSLVFATVVLERVLDMLAVLGLAFGLSLVTDTPATVRTGMRAFFAAAIAGLAVLVFLARNEKHLPAVVARLPVRARVSPLERLVGIVRRFAAGLCTLRDAPQFAKILALSGLAWAVAGAGMVCWIEAFHLPTPWYGGLFVLTVINLGGAIPSSPGSIGVYHYFAVLALSVWSVDRSAALAYAMATHGLNTALNVILGVLCLRRAGIGIDGLGRLDLVQTTSLDQKGHMQSQCVQDQGPKDD